ncbi:MAG: FAD-binding oxidoreductase [Pseudomonadota bacterium]
MNVELDQLASLAGAGGLLTGTDVSGRAAGIWDPSPIQADAIIRPRSTEQVSAILALCHQAGQSVVTHGGLTGLVQGAQTEAGDLVLSTERMNAIEDVDVAGRTMTVQAGVTLQAAQEAAEAVGLQLALDLGARGSCTIGGNLATNAGGNRVIRYGMARDQVLGLEAVLADGTVLSSMNHMLKNNAALDLKQLFIGSEGTLGIITRAVLRLRELPSSRCTALLALDSLDQVIALLKHCDAGLGGTLSAFEVMWQDFYRLVTGPLADRSPPLEDTYGYYVLVESLGGDEAQDQERFEAILGEAMEAGLVRDAIVAASGREREALWALRDDVELTNGHGPSFTFDVSLRVTDMADYLAKVRTGIHAAFPENHTWVFGHLGDGNLHIVVAVGDKSPESRRLVEQAVYTPLGAIGGSVSGEHGIGLEKKPWLHLSRSAEEIETLKRLKATFDPRGILNPGKVI